MRKATPFADLKPILICLVLVGFPNVHLFGQRFPTRNMIAVADVVATAAQEQVAPPPPPETEPTDPPQGQNQTANQNEILEVLEMRRRAGSISAILADLDPSIGDPDGRESQPDLDETFQQELNRLFEEAGQPMHAGQQRSAKQVEKSNTSPSPKQLPRYDRLPGEQKLSEHKVRVLRRASRQLEDAAWMLEEISDFEAADRIRHLATELRERGRLR